MNSTTILNKTTPRLTAAILMGFALHFSGCATMDYAPPSTTSSIEPRQALFYGFTSKGTDQDVRQALMRGASPNSRLEPSKPDSLTALGAAVMKGRTEAMILLLDAGADVNAEWKQGDNPLPMNALVLAVGTDQPHIVNLLLERGARINPVDEMNPAALDIAISKKNSALEARLLEAGANPNRAITLNVAALVGRHDLVAELLRNGVNPNTSPAGIPPALFQAVYNGDLETVTRLLDGGADPNLVHKDKGNTDRHVLVDATVNDNLDVLKLLLERGARVELEDPKALKPLDFAVRAKKPEAEALLMAAGANPLQASTLVEAVDAGRQDLIRLITEKAPHIIQDPSWCKYSLMIAVLDEDIPKLDAFLEVGTDLNQNVKDGTLLHLAVLFGKSNSIRALLTRGANPSPLSPTGLTPLHIAAGSGDTETARMLLDAGADKTLLYNNATPAQHAREKRMIQTANFIENHRR